MKFGSKRVGLAPSSGAVAVGHGGTHLAPGACGFTGGERRALHTLRLPPGKSRRPAGTGRDPLCRREHPCPALRPGRAEETPALRKVTHAEEKAAGGAHAVSGRSPDTHSTRHVHTHTHTRHTSHARTRHMRMRTHTHTCTQAHTRMHTHMHTCTHACTHAHTCMHVHTVTVACGRAP